MEKEIITDIKNASTEKENNMNIINISENNNFLQSTNTKSKNKNDNIFLSNNFFQNSINEQETTEQTYSFKPKKQETPNFLQKDEKIIVSDFLLINNEINENQKINEEKTVFTEILKTKIEFDENIEEQQKKYLEEIDEKKRIKNMKNEMEKRCKNLRDSIELNRKKLLENIKIIKSEKK